MGTLASHSQAEHIPSASPRSTADCCCPSIWFCHSGTEAPSTAHSTSGVRRGLCCPFTSTIGCAQHCLKTRNGSWVSACTARRFSFTNTAKRLGLTSFVRSLSLSSRTSDPPPDLTLVHSPPSKVSSFLNLQLARIHSQLLSIRPGDSCTLSYSLPDHCRSRTHPQEALSEVLQCRHGLT